MSDFIIISILKSLPALNQTWKMAPLFAAELACRIPHVSNRIKYLQIKKKLYQTSQLPDCPIERNRTVKQHHISKCLCDRNITPNWTTTSARDMEPLRIQTNQKTSPKTTKSDGYAMCRLGVDRIDRILSVCALVCLCATPSGRKMLPPPKAESRRQDTVEALHHTRHDLHLIILFLLATLAFLCLFHWGVKMIRVRFVVSIRATRVQTASLATAVLVEFIIFLAFLFPVCRCHNVCGLCAGMWRKIYLWRPI